MLANGYATPDGPRFTCIFQQGAADPWIARHGLTSADYQAAFDQFTGQGYLIDWVSGYFDGTQDLYAAIWRQPPNTPAWQARHGLTSEQYQATFDRLVPQGYKPVLVCGYSDGAQDLYAAIFRHLPGVNAWQARHGLTAAQYQAAFDQLVAEGFRLELVNGYSVAGQDLFAAIWTK